MATSHFPTLDARCPACGERTLIRGFQGRIACTGGDDCPDTDAANRLLNDPHITDHLVKVNGDGWTIRHPLAERVDNRLFRCPYGYELASQRAANRNLWPGTYLLDQSPVGQEWRLTPLDKP